MVKSLIGNNVKRDLMKKTFCLLLASLSFCLGSDFCAYDANGTCVAVLHNMQEAHLFLQEKGHKYYIATKEKTVTEKQSYRSLKPTKSSGNKKWYEVDWNEGVKLCPENKLKANKGIWIVNGSAHIDSTNCVYVDGTPYTRGILAIFAEEESDFKKADSNWILVNQTIVNLKGKTFIIYDGVGRIDDRPLKDTSYTVQMEYDLIVDKNELRIRDAIWLREGEKISEKYPVFYFRSGYYPSSDSLKVLDYPTHYEDYYLYLRSKKDGLEGAVTCPKPNRCFYNDSANGYRLPNKNEWSILQTAGQSKIFSWGNEFSEDSLKQYEDIHCAEKRAGIYPVRQYAPNQFGLYDTYGNAEEPYFNYDSYMAVKPCGPNLYYNLGKACRDLFQYKCLAINAPMNSTTFKLLGFRGMRMVRKLE